MIKKILLFSLLVNFAVKPDAEEELTKFKRQSFCKNLNSGLITFYGQTFSVSDFPQCKDAAPFIEFEKKLNDFHYKSFQNPQKTVESEIQKLELEKEQIDLQLQMLKEIQNIQKKYNLTDEEMDKLAKKIYDKLYEDFKKIAVSL